MCRNKGVRGQVRGTGYDHCYVHAPELAQERQRSNRRGGLASGNGRTKGAEIEALKKQASRLFGDVRSGKIPPGVGSVLVQALNCQIRVWETERRVWLREAEVLTQEQLRAEIERAAEIVQLHVKDAATLKAIREGLRQEDAIRRSR